MYDNVPESPIVVSCDWFALSCMLAYPWNGHAFALPSGWTCVPCSSTAVWEHRFFFLDELGNKVATFLCTPKSPIIDARRAIVEIANMWLYDYDFKTICNDVLNAFPLSVEGLNRVDICGDFHMTEKKWQVVRGIEAGAMYLKGLRRGVFWWSTDNNSRVPHQISWGGRDSVFHWKLYYKYKELHEGGVESSKPYIENTWKSLGLTPKYVWRLEVSVTSSNCLEKTDGSGKVQPFEWYDERVQLFERLYRDKFVIRMNEGHKDRRNDAIVTFLLGDNGANKFIKHRSEPLSEKESNAERRVVCKMWKEFNDSEVKANDFLHSTIAEFLRSMFQFQRNINAVCRRFNITETEVYKALEIKD